MMTTQSVPAHQTLKEIESGVLDVVAKQLCLPRPTVVPTLRLIEDLHCDSLELIELLMAIEDRFAVAISHSTPNLVVKQLFTRSPFRLSDLVEIVYTQQGTGRPSRGRRNARIEPAAGPFAVPFTQLSGQLEESPGNHQLYDSLGAGTLGYQIFRRRTDGMRCVLVPAATVQIGTAHHDALPDEQPVHEVNLDPFLIDVEAVSTTAYARFLNSIGAVDEADLRNWFVLDPDDRRRDHQLLFRACGRWQPVTGTERFPMILVSWFGANAYSLWANRNSWRDYRHESRESKCWLPSEAQWEYAARGPTERMYPWGDGPPTADRLQAGHHRMRNTYSAATLPLAAVNELLGMSPFGLHHTAGNVWQWCRDWYDAHFYKSPESLLPNAENLCPAGVRSERGGSWVSPVELSRSSYRRGRNPLARGRCLGFLCVGNPRG
jgi:acyl carrier protein